MNEKNIDEITENCDFLYHRDGIDVYRDGKDLILVDEKSENVFSRIEDKSEYRSTVDDTFYKRMK